MTAPIADVVRTHGRVVTVRCPYCDGLHNHGVEWLGRTERRSPACGLFRSPAQRAEGYIFSTKETTHV